MRKQDRVVFSKNPAPTDKHVQYIYKSYLRFKRDIVRSLGRAVIVDGLSENPPKQKDVRVSFKKKIDGNYIPILSMPLRLNSPDLERIQIYEMFFPLYRRMRQLLIQDMHDKLLDGNVFVFHKGPPVHQILARMGAINLLCQFMLDNRLDLRRLETISGYAGTKDIPVGSLQFLSKLSEEAGHNQYIHWSFYRANITRGDLFGDHQKSWWDYVKKFHPYKDPNRFPKVFFNCVDT